MASIPVHNKLAQQANDVEPSELKSSLRGLSGLTRFEVFGHSYAIGSTTDPDRDVMTRLASMFGGSVLEINRAIGGAIGGWHNNDVVGSQGNGGFGSVFNYHFQGARYRPSGTVATATNTTTFTMSNIAAGVQQTPWAAGMRICYVRASDGSKVIRDIKAVNQTTQPQTITLYSDDPLPWAPTVGDRVFEVPHAYQPNVPWAIDWIGIHDVMVAGSHEAATTSWGKHQGKHFVMNALRSAVSFLLCAEAFDAINTSVVGGGGAPAPALNLDPVGAMYANYTIGPLANSNTITIHVPPNFPGGAVYLGFLAKEGTTSGSRGGGTVSFTVDGSGAGQTDLECRYGMYTDPLPDQKYNAFTKGFKNLLPGAHTIVATVANAGVNFYFNWWGIESYPSRPLVIIPPVSRLKSYQIYGPGYDFQPVKGNVNASHAIGTSAFTITPATKDVDGTDTQQAIKANEFITFDPGGANEEILEVQTDVAPGGTSVTTKTPSTKAHNSPEAYEANVSNRRLHQIKSWWTDLANEFAPTDGRPNSVIAPDVDVAINGGAYPTTDPNAFLGDSAHLSNNASKRVAKVIYEAVEASSALDLDHAAWNALPTAPLPGQAEFFSSNTAAAAPVAPGGANAIADAFPNIHPKVDLRRCRYARVLVRLTVAATGATFGRVEFKDIAGSWRSLGVRESIQSGTHNNVVLEPGHVSVGAGPPATSTTEVNQSYGERGEPGGWFYVNPLVWLTKDVELRYVHGNRTVTTTAPSYTLILVQFQ